MVVHISNPSPGETNAGGLSVLGQLGLPEETLSNLVGPKQIKRIDGNIDK